MKTCQNCHSYSEGRCLFVPEGYERFGPAPKTEPTDTCKNWKEISLAGQGATK